MGPINFSWIRTNGEQWSCGRIDIRGNTASDYGDEIALPMMLNEDWARLSHWLDSYTSEQPESLEQILDAYYNAGYKDITWWRQ